MSQKLSQNIFTYATSELSQDAFLSLLVAWFDNEDKELKKISKDFINTLYNEYFDSNTVLDIESIKLKQQHFKIDVYFEVTEKNGNVIPFIIEDKTWTEPHSKQLTRYVDKVIKTSGVSKDEIVKIFFKTGHITEKDKHDTQNFYKILDVQWMWSFISKYHVDHIIFEQYVDFIKKEFYSKMYDMKTDSKKELKDWEYSDAQKGYVQYQIVEYVKTELLKVVKVTTKNHIRYVRNGKAWNTWWTFYEEPNQYSIFLKIVHLNGAPRIRLVEYSHKNTTADQKQKSLATNIDIASKVIKNNKKYENIQCGDKKKYQVNSGKNKGSIVRESEIANLNLENKLSLLENAQIFTTFLEMFLSEKQSC